jgi:hypothetical protein
VDLLGTLIRVVFSAGHKYTAIILSDSGTKSKNPGALF